MEIDWIKRAKGLLRSEMTRRDVSYDDLVRLLGEIGIEETSANLRNKVSRGSFTAAFLLQCLKAMGVETLHLD